MRPKASLPILALALLGAEANLSVRAKSRAGAGIDPMDMDVMFIGAHPNDDMVVCNIAPDDVKAQLRSDAVGITVEPSGTSRDTSATL